MDTTYKLNDPDMKKTQEDQTTKFSPERRLKNENANGFIITVVATQKCKIDRWVMLKDNWFIKATRTLSVSKCSIYNIIQCIMWCCVSQFNEVAKGRVPANIYLFKSKNSSNRKRRQICSKLTIKTKEGRHWRRSGVFIVNFKHILHLFLVFLLLTFNK